MTDLVKQIGFKAYSLKLLKDNDLFEGSLLLGQNLPAKEKFFKNLKKAGLGRGERLVVRYSYPDERIKLPRGVFANVEELYEFLKETYKKDFTFIIYDFTVGRFGGTISRVDGELVVEFVEGDWNADYVMNMDMGIFKDRVSKWYLYKDNRKVPYIEKEEVKLREIEPLSDDTVRKLLQCLKPKISNIEKLLSGEFNSLEFIIGTNFKFKGIELHNIEAREEDFNNKKPLDDYFELKTPHDLRRWDRKTKLLVSIPASVDRADALLGVIHKIKKYTNHVFISYGFLSHPAILLREAGIQVERRISNYRTVSFNYN